MLLWGAYHIFLFIHLPSILTPSLPPIFWFRWTAPQQGPLSFFTCTWNTLSNLKICIYLSSSFRLPMPQSGPLSLRNRIMAIAVPGELRVVSFLTTVPGAHHRPHTTFWKRNSKILLVYIQTFLAFMFLITSQIWGFFSFVLIKTVKLYCFYTALQIKQ